MQLELYWVRSDEIQYTFLTNLSLNEPYIGAQTLRQHESVVMFNSGEQQYLYATTQDPSATHIQSSQQEQDKKRRGMSALLLI